MLSTTKKVQLGSIVLAEIACLVGAIWCYGKAQYYRGRVDAYSEVTKDLENIKDEIENRQLESKEEAE